MDRFRLKSGFLERIQERMMSRFSTKGKADFRGESKSEDSAVQDKPEDLVEENKLEETGDKAEVEGGVEIGSDDSGSIQPKDSKEAVFNSEELMEKIFGYLTPDELLRCRQARKLVWKAEVDKILEKKHGPLLGHPYISGKSHPYDQGQLRMLAKHRRMKATWLYGVNVMEEFLDDMQDYKTSPFPTGTVIIEIENFSVELPEETKKYKSIVTKLFARFGPDIKRLFVVFSDPTEKDREEYKNQKRCNYFLQKIFQCPNLEFLSLFRRVWPDVDRMSVPVLKKLTHVQICGYGNVEVFNNLLVKTGNAKQILELHLDGAMDPSKGESIILPPCKLPNLKKLMLYRYAGFVPRHNPFVELEEFGLTYATQELAYSTFINGLLWMDKTYSKTLRKITLRADEYVYSICSRDCCDPKDKNLEKTVKVQYPYVKEVDLSYDILLASHKVIDIFAAKFPQWEELHLYELCPVPFICPTPEEIQRNGPKSLYSFENIFEEVCEDLWDLLPKTVTLVTDSRNTKMYRPKTKA